MASANYSTASAENSHRDNRPYSGCVHGWRTNCALSAPDSVIRRSGSGGSGPKTTVHSTLRTRRSAKSLSSDRHSRSRGYPWGDASERSAVVLYNPKLRSRNKTPDVGIEANSPRGCADAGSSKEDHSSCLSSSCSSASRSNSKARKRSSKSHDEGGSTSKNDHENCQSRRDSQSASTRCSATRLSS